MAGAPTTLIRRVLSTLLNLHSFSTKIQQNSTMLQSGFFSSPCINLNPTTRRRSIRPDPTSQNWLLGSSPMAARAVLGANNGLVYISLHVWIGISVIHGKHMRWLQPLTDGPSLVDLCILGYNHSQVSAFYSQVPAFPANLDHPWENHPWVYRPITTG